MTTHKIYREADETLGEILLAEKKKVIFVNFFTRRYIKMWSYGGGFSARLFLPTSLSEYSSKLNVARDEFNLVPPTVTANVYTHVS